MQPDPFTFVRRRFAGRCFAATATLCLLHCWFVPAAQASCGDYVHTNGLHGSMTHRGLREGHLPHGHLPDGGQAAEQEPRRVPCTGPNCSRPSGPPVEPPATSSVVDHYDWGWSAPGDAADTVPSRRISPIPNRPHPILTANSVFRPPRPLGSALA
ncbi:MAG TPA: hypothetical protein VGN42_17480 [Pirellulales bacterium]|nr:hypothetical protein [Pirellulales bacterium]